MPFWEVNASLSADVSSGECGGTEGVKLSAGRLIEKAGLKGYSKGKVGTSPQNALVIINEGGTAAEVLEVMEHIQSVVKEQFGVELQPEVVIPVL
ncbi:MAG: hypothetical protein LBD75_01190 [Candidatus Peribacteria bacterium]|nr:hypothetical protein [Candidatus Peribacteria bacterium]